VKLCEKQRAGISSVAESVLIYALVSRRLKAAGGASKRKKAAAAAGKPKRPPSAFFVFM
jgi:hypothetical protein